MEWLQRQNPQKMVWCVFASQVFGYYMIGDYEKLLAIDLKLGLKYNLK